MKTRISSGVGCAAILAFAVAAAAQQPTTPPTSTPQTATPQTTTRSTADQDVTVTGCVQKEADFRQARDAGKGGVAGTGAGAGNEFVLINASMGASDPTTPTGTSGSTAAGSAYEVTGPNEGQLANHIGKRVEIRGKVKASETTAGGQPTGGATAGTPPRGVDVGGKDLKLRELEITSVREVSGSCPAGK
jgi:hypothetical protein